MSKIKIKIEIEHVKDLLDYINQRIEFLSTCLETIHPKVDLNYYIWKKELEKELNSLKTIKEMLKIK